MAIGYSEAINNSEYQMIEKIKKMITRHVPNLPRTDVEKLAKKYRQQNGEINQYSIENFIAREGY